MPTALEDPPAARRQAAETATPAARLRGTMAAVRVMFTWLGTRKALTPDQKSQAAESFGAERAYLSAGKKLLDVSHPAFRAVTAVRGRILHYWKGASLPYPETGIRLIRQDDIASFTVQLTSFQAELADAVEQLCQHYDDLKSAARERLGRLYNVGDYPTSLQGWFDVSFDFPSVEPPQYLRQLAPALYQQESQRVAARFEEAVALAEAAFAEELSRLVAHLGERLAGRDDGRPKVFRDSAVDNLRDFFARFRQLNVGSSPELEALVDEAQRIVRGVAPQQLRSSDHLRQQVAQQLSSVAATLDGQLVERPRRNILRRAK